MHVVTKILIVFGAILSIFLAALTIAFASSADAIRASVASEQASAAAAKAQQNEITGKAALDLAKADADKSDLANKMSAMQTQLSNALNERSKNLADLSEAKLSLDKLKGQLAGLEAAAQLNAQTLKAVNEELVTLRESSLKGTLRETQLVERLNDVENQKQVLDQSVRALQEQLTETKMALERQQTGIAGDPSAPRVNVFGPLVSARVKSVNSAANGKVLVVISAGSSSGLKNNQLLDIVRDKDYIGKLTITELNANEASGLVDTLGRNISVQADDVVLSRLGG
ncbi:MAG: hypothetical protein ACREJO_15515 [Phycisphaerales bacterium]